MSIQQGMCNSFKLEILQGLHLATHDYYIALFTDSAELNKTTTTYTGKTGEVTGTGYTTGGKLLLGHSITLIDDIAVVNWSTNPEWDNASFTTRGALIYNNSLASKNTVAVLDFGQNYNCVNGTFTITFPPFGATTSIIRVV